MCIDANLVVNGAGTAQHHFGVFCANQDKPPTSANSSLTHSHSRQNAFSISRTKHSRKYSHSQVKEAIIGLKRPRGRPRKQPSIGDALPTKRKVGRPSKVKDSGGVVVELGKLVSLILPSCPYI